MMMCLFLGMFYIIFISSSAYCYILCLGKCVTYLGGFSAHGFFADGFLFLVKKLGLLNNLGHLG
jgi:hypothetical protein